MLEKPLLQEAVFLWYTVNIIINFRVICQYFGFCCFAHFLLHVLTPCGKGVRSGGNFLPR